MEKEDRKTVNSLRSHRTSEEKMRTAHKSLQPQTSLSGIILGSFWNSCNNGSCIALGHQPLIETLDTVQCNGFPICLVTRLYYSINAKYIALSFWKSIKKQDDPVWVTTEWWVSGSPVIYSEDDSVTSTSSRTIPILKGKTKNQTENKFKSQIMGSDPVSVTDWERDLQQALSRTASFSCMRNRAKIPSYAFSQGCYESRWILATAFWTYQRLGREKTWLEGWQCQCLCYDDSHVY